MKSQHPPLRPNPPINRLARLAKLETDIANPEGKAALQRQFGAKWTPAALLSDEEQAAPGANKQADANPPGAWNGRYGGQRYGGPKL